LSRSTVVELRYAKANQLTEKRIKRATTQIVPFSIGWLLHEAIQVIDDVCYDKSPKNSNFDIFMTLL
jgi:hypothetical protein